MRSARSLVGGTLLAASLAAALGGCAQPEKDQKVRITGEREQAVPTTDETTTSTTSTTTTSLYYGPDGAASKPAEATAPAAETTTTAKGR